MRGMYTAVTKSAGDNTQTACVARSVFAFFGMVCLCVMLGPALATGSARSVLLQDYVKTAEIILIGTVAAVEETGERLKFKRGAVSADQPFLRATIRVKQVIKGPRDLDDVVIHATDAPGHPSLVVNEESVFFIYQAIQSGPWKGKRTAGQVGIREGMAEPVNMTIKGETLPQEIEQFIAKIQKALHGG
jgi:hypothetical protein